MKKILKTYCAISYRVSLKPFTQLDSIYENKEYRNGYISFAQINLDKSTSIDAGGELH